MTSRSMHTESEAPSPLALLAQAEDIEHIQQCFRENAYG